MNLKKSKKKIILITLIILFTIGASVLFYFLFVKKDSEDIWYDSNWSYRRSIYLTDIPREYQNTQQDILIQFDTETLIAEGKLENDCKDIRFVDGETNLPLQYWIEGGCNTKSTQIWARKFLTKESQQFIFMYYGNKLATDNQESWAGEFLALSTDKCQEDWSLAKNFEGRFIVGNQLYGQLGGNLNHKHTISDTKENCEDLAYIAKTTESNNCDSTKDNILAAELTDVNNIPNYENINICKSKNGYITSEFISVLSAKPTPEGWSHISILDNKYPRGNDASSPKISLSHIHNTQCLNENLEIKDGNQKYISLNSKSKTEPIEEDLPYIKINLISTNDDKTIRSGDIMMFTQLPPLGWNYVQDFDGKFLKGSDSDFLSTNERNSHKHTINPDISIKNTTEKALSNLDTSLTCVDGESIEFNTTDESIIPPYITVIFGEKKSSISTAMQINIGDEERGEVLGTTGSGPSVPTDLKTEGETNPTDVTTSTPGFTAVFNHPDYP